MSQAAKSSLFAALLSGFLGGAAGAALVALAIEGRGAPLALVAAPEPAAAQPAAEARPDAIRPAAEVEAALADLRQQIAGLRGLQAESAATRNGAGDLVRRAPGTPVSETEVLRQLEVEQAVARFRGLRTRQERARDSVARILGEAAVPEAAKAALDPILRDYFEQERALLMVDRNRLDDAARAMLERQHQELRQRTSDLLARCVGAPTATALADQLAQGGPAGRSQMSGNGLRGVQPGEIQLPAPLSQR